MDTITNIEQKENGLIPLIIRIGKNKTLKTMVLKKAKFCVIQAAVNMITGGTGGSVAAYLYFAGEKLLFGDITIGEIYEKSKDKDGNLIIDMISQNVFG